MSPRSDDPSSTQLKADADGGVQELQEAIKDRDQQLVELLADYSERNLQLVSALQVISEQNLEILSQQNASKAIKAQVENMYRSTSWRVTAPLRAASITAQKVKHAAAIFKAALEGKKGLGLALRQAQHAYAPSKTIALPSKWPTMRHSAWIPTTMLNGCVATTH